MIGTLLNDRYRLDAELGRGGMGVVYRAHDLLLDRAVAVKVLNGGGIGSEGRTWLQREAQAAARLNHTNIVSIYDAGEVAGTPFIVMELVEGQTLRQRLPASLEETLFIIRELCAALEHAHRKGIVHRDIKPENVVILASGLVPVKGADSVKVKLMDFGLAHTMAAPRLTQDGTIMGTSAYIAPEIVQDLPATPQSDLYELGAMWYELIAGRVPFQGDSAMSIMLKHLYEPPLPPSNFNPAITPALDMLVLKLLSKSPGDRPASARELSDIIEQFDRSTASGTWSAVEVSPLDRLARNRLVGREHELSEALGLWQQAKYGAGQVLLISGEPGIGKTRLMRELAARVALTGGQVFSGECYAEGSAPYAPIAQIIETASSLHPDLLLSDPFDSAAPRPGSAHQGGDTLPLPRHPLTREGATPGISLADLLKFAPALRAQYPNVPSDPPLDALAEQQRLFESITSLMAVLCQSAPVLLVVDDAHWADSGTLAVLRYLARRAPRLKLKLLIVLLYREIGLAEAQTLVEVLHDLNREHLATRLKLTRFDRARTHDLLTTILTEEVTAEFLNGIYQETEGNPFFVEEVCKALVESGKLTFTDGRWQRGKMAELELPQSVRLAIQSRVGKLPEQAQDTLRLAAILGREFEFGVLQAMSDLDGDALLDGLERAERAQLIGELRGPGSERFAFAHALIPSTPIESVSGLRRRRLHRRAAQALERLHADRLDAIAAQLGHHYAEAEDADKAVAYLLKAGDQAYAVFAYPEAIDAYQQALAFLDEQEAHERAARTLMKLGLIYHVTLDFRRSQQAYQEGFALWQRAGETSPAALPPAPHAFRTVYPAIVTLDPALINDFPSAIITDHLFSGLVELNSQLEVVPDVARSWEVLDNGQKYIFHLRDDVCWSDGMPVTAGDFEFAWKRALAPATHSPAADLLLDIRGARAFHAGEVATADGVGVQALDTHTLAVELESPIGYLLHLVARSPTYPVPQHVVDAHGAAWTQVEHIVTNGPFCLTAWQPGEVMRLKRNPGYHGRFGGNLQEIEHCFSVESPARLDLYESDQLDMCDFAPVVMDQARARRTGEYVSIPGSITEFVGFDLSRPPFHDLRVRRAFAHALDRETLAAVIARGYAAPATGGLVPPGLPGHSPGISLPYDPERARQLLAEAGYPEGRGFPPVTVLWRFDVNEAVAQYVEAQWRKNLGVEMIWERPEPGSHITRLREARPQLFDVGWVADYPDPDTFLRVALALYYPSGWNETYTQLVEAARRVLDQSERMKVHQQADALLIEEAAIIPVVYGRVSFLVKPWVSRFPISAFRWFFFKDIVIEPH